MNTLSKRMELLEQKKRLAVIKWLSENPNKTINDISKNTTVVLNEEIIYIGNIVYDIRLCNVKLTEEGREFWINELGLVIGKKIDTVEFNNRMAFEKWLSENPDKNINYMNGNETVEFDGRIINIGKIVNSIKFMDVRLTKDRKEYWEEKHGLLIGSRSDIKEKKKREALEFFLRENPDKTINDITNNEVVELYGKKINIGNAVKNIRLGKIKLTEENKKYWIHEKGLILNSQNTSNNFVKKRKK